MPALRRVWRLFNAGLFPVATTDRLFNQYRDTVAKLDVRGGATHRRRNLRSYLASFDAAPDVLVVGEAIGYQGGRFTGVPLTSERLLSADPCIFPFSARCTSRGGPFAEPTATVLWQALAPHRRRVFTWNAVPLHPHHLGDPLSNRTPTATELGQFVGLVGGVYSLLKPMMVVALGNSAARSLGELGIEHVKVRHPANGGVPAFRRGIAEVLASLPSFTTPI